MISPLIDVSGYTLNSRLTGDALLSDISVQINDRARIGISGPSGSGKSILCYCLAGIQKEMVNGVEAGTVIRRESARKGRKNVAMVLQNPEVQLFSDTVKDELDAAAAGEPERYDTMGLGEMLPVKVKNLSIGYKQRLSIASQLLRGADLLIIDEPSNNLDRDGMRYLRTALDEYPGALIIIDHNNEFLIDWAEQIWEMEKGRIVFSGSPADWLASDTTSQGLHRLYRKCFLSGETDTRDPVSNSNVGNDLLPEISIPEAKRITGINTGVIPVFEAVSYSAGYSDRVIRDLSLSLIAGERIAVIGPGGSGKTTLLKSIMGLTKIFEGSCSLKGKKITGKPSYEIYPGAALLFQNPDHQIFENSVLRECALGLDHHQYSKEEIRRLAVSWLTEFGLGEFLERFPFGLSYGEKRRLTLASLLAAAPDLMLLDEPTTALDEDSIHRLVNILKVYSERSGAGILFTTHDLNFALSLGTRIIFLSEGRMIRDIPRQDIRREDLEQSGYEIPLSSIWLHGEKERGLTGLYEALELFTQEERSDS